jgi:glutamate 5-kinase
MSTQTPALADFRRIVVKVGSSLLVDSAKGALRQEWLEALVEDLAERAKAGVELLVVSSGAIAMGRNVLKLPRGE